MAGKSYLYTSLINSTDSFDLSTLGVPLGGILTITTGGGLATPGIAVAGTDYIKNLSSSTGIVIGTPVAGVTPIDLPDPTAGSILVGNGTEYIALRTGDLNDVLTVTTVDPVTHLTVGWKPATAGDPSTWAQYPADADVNLQDPITSTTYHRLYNVDSVSFHQHTADFLPTDNPALWTYFTGGKGYLVFGSNALGRGNLIQGTYADIVSGHYAAKGSILRGNGTTYDAYPIGADNQVLTVEDGTFKWKAPQGGDPATWSSYPALTEINANGNFINNLSLINIGTNILAVPQPSVGGTFYVDNNGKPAFASSIINNNNIVTAEQTDTYGQLGSLLYGNGVDYNILSPRNLGDVLTITNPGPGFQPTWAPPTGGLGSSNIAVVDCVMWISAGYAGLNAYTYNNGVAGVGATLTYNSNFVFSYYYTDNYFGPTGVEGILAGTRILVVDQNNPTYSGIYVLTQVGSGSTPPILTRATDWDMPSQLLFGRRIYVTPYIPVLIAGYLWNGISTFSGQFLTFMTSGVSVIGTTPFKFISSAFNTSTFIESTGTRGAFIQFIPLPANCIQSVMPNGGRKFYTSSFSFYVDIITPGAFTPWDMTLGKYDSAGNNYTPYTQLFSVNVNALAGPQNQIIPTQINGVASTLNPIDLMGFAFSNAPVSSSGTFTYYQTFFGQWVE